ncbi:MAG: acyl-CoA dehydrogenase [Deltaproteobacteria bacterium]|nr:acyl-CoA dehydrogenase [Candidatus Anaeroferrophillacea bacterium]
MGSMLVNRRDQQFVLFEQLGVEKLFTAEKFHDYTAEDVRMLIGEAEKFAVNELEPAYKPGDEQGCTFTDGIVKAPPAFHEPYRKLCAAGWNCATKDPDVGGQGMPLTVFNACAEWFNAANFPLMMYPGLTWGAANLIDKYGSEEQRQRYMMNMYAGTWGGTMCLTEPGAGSDVGALKTRAVRRDDGTWLITGTKIFISCGDHDMCGNIVHMVLARIEGDPPGTDGISIFIVPKYRVGADGQPGEVNDVSTGNIEHKMGIKGSATCVLNFGENDACIGELLGEARSGMRIMFNMMNEARLEVGMQGLGHASAAFEHALAYARERVQSRAVWDFANPAASPVPIIEHADVRRVLLWMKAYVEGIRSLNYSLAYAIDFSEVAGDAAERERWHAIAELLTPVCKAFSSDRAVDICSLAIDTYGGYGYCSEYPVEQYMRDAKIACLYEGTNGIQALDLVARKLPSKGGRAVTALFKEIGATAAKVAKEPALKRDAGILGNALQAVSGLTRQFGVWAEGAGLVVPILYARPYLDILGDLLVGWHLLQGAAIAVRNLEKLYGAAGVGSDAAGRRALARTDNEIAFYEGKVAAAKFFAVNILHGLPARCESIGMMEKVPVEMLDRSLGMEG